MIKRTILFFTVLCAAVCGGAQTIAIDPEARLQTVEGWGTSICWWGNVCGHLGDEQIDELVDWLVSSEGLNFNVFRYNIGGGDDPLNRNCDVHHMARGKGLRAEMPGFKLFPDSPYDWEADSAQTKVLLKIKERRPDAVFEAFSNSAPWFMTESGCCAGNKKATDDNLRPECYEDFCRYLVDVCKHFKDAYGVEFATLEPFNESHSNYWPQNGSQEGCHFDTPSQVALIKTLFPILKASGLKTVISASDETNTAQSLRVLKGYDDEALSMLGQWNTHTYSATNAERCELRDRIRTRGLKLWQSESGSGGKGIHGNLNMLQRLFDDMRYLQPAVWCDWQYVEDNNDQWSLVSRNPADNSFLRHNNYYVRMHVTRFIRQGYTILETSDEQTLAAVSPDRKEVVVVSLNNSDENRSFTYSFHKKPKRIAVFTTTDGQHLVKAKTAARKLLAQDLAPHSVRTFVVGF